MKLIAILLAATCLLSCSKHDIGSNCTDQPITILESRDQKSAAYVVEPLIYVHDEGRPVITVGRYDAFQILTARSKKNANVSRSASLLRAFLDKAVQTGTIVNSAAIYPDLSKLKGSELADAVLVRHELMVLFGKALAHGKAMVGKPDSAPASMTIQRYEATVPGGSLWGVRTMVGGELIYDYCGVTPGGT